MRGAFNSRDWWAISLSTSPGIGVRLVVAIRRPPRSRTPRRRRSDRPLRHRPGDDYWAMFDGADTVDARPMRQRRGLDRLLIRLHPRAFHDLRPGGRRS